MVPVRERGHEDALEVVEDRFERLATFRRTIRQRVANVTGRDARQDRITLGVAQVLGDPLHQGVAMAPELRRVHYLWAAM